MRLEQSLIDKDVPENYRGESANVRIIFLFLLIVFPIIFFGGVSQTTAPFSRTRLAPVVFYPSFFVAAGLLILIFSWFFMMFRRRLIVFRVSSVDLPVLFLILYVLIRAIISEAPYLVWTEFLNLLILAGFFYCALNFIKSGKEVKRLTFLLIFFAFLLSIYGIVNNFILKRETVLWLGRPTGYKDRVSATYICPNHFAGFLAMVIPFALSYLIILKRKYIWKLFFSILMLVMIAGMVLSQSRGGWAALTAGMLTVALVSIRKVKIPVYAVILPALIIAGLLVFLESNTSTLYDRVTNVFEEGEQSISSRKDAWKDTYKLVAGWHFLGSGPGTYEYAITRYQQPGFFVRINSAHNDYLQALAEYGAIGFVIILTMVFLTIKSAGRLVNFVTEYDDLAYITGYIGALVAIGVHSFVDFNMRIPANAILLISLTGVLCAIRAYTAGNNKKCTLLDFNKLPSDNIFLRIFPVFLALLFLLAGLAFIGKRYLGSYYHHLARQKDVSINQPISKEIEIEEDIKKEVVDNYLKARLFDPSNPIHAGALSNIFVLQSRSPLYYDFRGNSPSIRAKATLGLSMNEREELMEKVVERVMTGALYGEEAIQGNPMNALYHLRLAQAYDFLGTIQRKSDFLIPDSERKSLLSPEEYIIRAQEEYELTVAQHPNYPYYNQELARFYLRAGKYEDARKRTLITIELFKSRPVWYVHPVLEVLEGVAEAYIKQGEYELASVNMEDALRYMPEWKKKSRKIQDMQEQIEKGLEQLSPETTEQ